MDISIIITTFNYSRYIERCLRSCLDQHEANLEYEVIIIDDGSTDDTQQILSNYVDSRVRSFAISNSGIEVASNRGFEIANGRFVVRVDADDTLTPNYLVSMASLLEEEFYFYYSNYEVIDEFDKVQDVVALPSFNTDEVLSRGDFLATGTIYPSAVLRSIGGYNTSTKNSGLENYELIVKLIKLGLRGKHIPLSLFQYRQHGTNMSAIRKSGIITYGKKLFDLNQLGAYRTNEYHPYKLTLG